MKLYYNPLDKDCKSITGAIPCSQEITFHVYKQESGEETFSANCCNFILFQDGEEPTVHEMERVDDGWCITLKVNKIGLYFYHFQLNDKFLGCGLMRGGVLSDYPKSYQLTVYDERFTTPEWMKGGIMYQIFPDRFAKSGDCTIAPNKVFRHDWGGMPRFRPNEFGKVLNNDFFGGNFNGIRSKLDYLKGLNVTVLYLNPIFEAFSNHRYDTGDYMKVDSLLGSEEDFDRLVSDAKNKGISIILDGVFNHTGDDSRYFNRYGRYDELGAHQSKDSKYSEWYNFYDFPNGYDSWWGIDTLPAVNESSPSYQDFIFGENGVLRNWLRHGIAGYRLDVADELPDFFIEKIRSSVKTERKDAIVIGEVWEDASNKIAYSQRRKYFHGKELDSVMNYPLKDAIIGSILRGNTTPLRETVAMLIDHYPKQVLDSLMNILGTHDTCRILTVFGEQNCANKDEMAATVLTDEQKELAKARLKMAAVLQYTLPGVPCIYYGDENAMEGYIDPFCRQCYDWSNQDEEMLSFYRKLGKIREKTLFDILKEGEYREVYADRYFLVYERFVENQRVYVYVNFSTNEYKMDVEGTFKELISGKTIKKTLGIERHSFGILLKKE